MTALSPARLAARTPADRDRYLDFLRALAIAVVVAGHWLMAIIWVSDGELRAESLLTESALARGLTWVVQIMPVFFLVGGVVNARSWRSATDRGDSYGTWLRGRAARLLRPTLPLVWFWALTIPLLAATGLAPDLLRMGSMSALVALWFLAVYLGVIALVPVLLALHERFGLRLVAGLAVAAALVDVAVRLTGSGLVGLVNFLLVWSAPTALGFCWADGLLESRTARRLLPLAGAVGLLVAVSWLGYPVSMVGVDGAERTNNSPPTVALVLLGCVQAGVVLAVKAPVQRWLRRPAVWAGVVRLNLVAMTVYLWHLTVMVLVVAAVYVLGWWPPVEPLSAVWWATRPLWIGALAVCLAPVVAVLGRVELSTPQPGRGASGPALAAVVAASVAVAVLVKGNVTLLPVAALTAAAVALGAYRLPVRRGV
jgi:fucose 4-O-acetylase-like acetyltransferase